jgi:hypothetical protein
MPPTTMEKTMTRHIANFTIGFFASLCAVFVPRMLAMLNSGGNEIQLLSVNYVAVGMLFSLIIGGVTAILEQARSRTAAERFMSALGIPALLAGALSTGTASVDLRNSEASNQKLTAALQKQSGIRISDEPAMITPLQPVRDDRGRFDFSLIPSAYAGDDAAQPQQVAVNLGIQVEQKPYVVVLEKSKSEAEALKKAEKLRKTVPNATAVRSGDRYLVIDGTATRTKSDAMLRAIELKNQTKLKPYLLQVK